MPKIAKYLSPEHAGLQKWIAALQSGKYGQTSEVLRDLASSGKAWKNAYCCLGVLTELNIPDFFDDILSDPEKLDVWDDIVMTSYIPNKAVRNFCGESFDTKKQTLLHGEIFIPINMQVVGEFDETAVMEHDIRAYATDFTSKLIREQLEGSNGMDDYPYEKFDGAIDISHVNDSWGFDFMQISRLLETFGAVIIYTTANLETED